MFSINMTESCQFEVTERVHPRSLSQYSNRTNSRFVVKEGVLRKGFLYMKSATSYCPVSDLHVYVHTTSNGKYHNK